jgi:hypothetical protein
VGPPELRKALSAAFQCVSRYDPAGGFVEK